MAQKSKVKNFISFLVRFGLSFLLLKYLFSKIDLKQTLDVVKSADIVPMVYAFLVFLVIYAILLIRWMVFIKAMDLKVNFFEVTRLYFAGLFGNLFLPSAIGGDIIKIVGLCKNNSQKPRVVASVLLDRLSGFAGVVIVGFTAFILGYKMINDFSLLLSIGILTGVSGVVVLILFNEKIYKLMIQIFSAFPKFKESLMQMHYDVMLMKDRPMEGWKAIGLSCLTQAILSLSFYFISIALHQNIPYMYFLIFVPLMCVAAMVPSIGGLGVREAGAAYLFGKVGVASGIAVSMSLINFSFMVVTGLLGGLFYVVTIYSRRL